MDGGWFLLLRYNWQSLWRWIFTVLQREKFNVKVKLKDQGDYPALAVGLNDFAGTGIYASEYLVSSYKINNFDFTLGIGWGNLAGSATFKNPFKIISDSFGEQVLASGEGGEF